MNDLKSTSMNQTSIQKNKSQQPWDCSSGECGGGHKGRDNDNWWNLCLHEAGIRQGKFNASDNLLRTTLRSWYINPMFFFCLISGGAFWLLATIAESCKVHARRTRVRGSIAYRQGRHMMMIDLDRRMELLSYVTAGFDCINYVTFKFTLIIFKWLFPCIHHPFMLGFRHLNHTDTARLCGLSSIGVGIFIVCDRVLSAGQSPFTTLWYEYDPLHYVESRIGSQCLIDPNNLGLEKEQQIQEIRRNRSCVMLFW